jgi:hypothetical protein
MEQSALSLVQLISSVPPFAPRQDQVDDPPPHDPAIFPELVPVVQENCVELSQAPCTIQGAFDLVQLVSSDPPHEPRQVHVDDPPQDPATFAVSVPVVQAN